MDIISTLKYSRTDKSLSCLVCSINSFYLNSKYHHFGQVRLFPICIHIYFFFFQSNITIFINKKKERHISLDLILNN